MAAKTTFSLEEFLKLPEHEEDGTHYELDEGELIRLSPAGKNHSIVNARVAAYLDGLLDPGRFTVLGGEAGAILSGDPKPTVRGADVAVCVGSADSIRSDSFATEPFLVAVEIVSAHDDAQDLERKVAQYLRAGVREVWVVYTSVETIYVHTPDKVSRFQRGGHFRSSALEAEIDTERFFTR